MLELAEVNWATRRMFPPPSTMAIWVPSPAARAVCRAMWTTASMAIPRSPACVKPSPEIFSTTRLGRGPGFADGPSSSDMRLLLPEFPVDKADDFQAAGLGDLADGLLLVFSLDVRLVPQAMLLVEFPQPALDHLLDDFFRLAFLAGLGAEDFALLCPGRRIEVLPRDHRGPHGGNVHREVLGQGRVASLHLQEHAGFPVVMHVPAAPPVDPRDPLQPEDLPDPVHQLVQLRLERFGGLARRRLLQQFLGRGRSGSRGQLPGQIAGQLDEF